MQPIRGLTIFSRESGQRSWTIASWHSPHSLTWRWGVSFRMFVADEWRVRPLWWSYRDNNGLQWGARIPWLGIIDWHQQHPMWFRDLWQRLRDQRDGLIPREEEPPPPARVFRPVVIDGGQSLR